MNYEGLHDDCPVEVPHEHESEAVEDYERPLPMDEDGNEDTRWHEREWYPEFGLDLARKLRDDALDEQDGWVADGRDPYGDWPDSSVEEFNA